MRTIQSKQVNGRTIELCESASGYWVKVDGRLTARRDAALEAARAADAACEATMQAERTGTMTAEPEIWRTPERPEIPREWRTKVYGSLIRMGADAMNFARSGDRESRMLDAYRAGRTPDELARDVAGFDPREPEPSADGPPTPLGGFSGPVTVTAPARQTLASLKRRIKVGTRLLCVENTYRPELNGTERVVARTLTVAFTRTPPGQPDARQSWTDYPKARSVRWIDADTFELELFRGQREHYVRLRFLN